MAGVAAVVGWPGPAAAALAAALAALAAPSAAQVTSPAATPPSASPVAPASASPSPSPSPSASPSPSPSPGVVTGLSDLPAGRAAAVESVVLAAMARHGVPGLAAAVVVDRVPRWSAGFGFSDVENSVPVTPATMYRLASVSKPIVATAALQLVQRGRLDLDAPLQRYVPTFPAKPWPLTTRHLLSHQSGIRNWTQAEFHNTRRYRSLYEALSAFGEDDLLFEPGTRLQYSSFGYTLLGAVVEGAGGAPLVELLRSNVFGPAGMESARDDDVLAIVPRRARGYQRSADGRLLNAPLSDTSNRMPGGGLVASVDDVARFASALLEGALLDRETLRLAFTPQKLRGGGATGYGLGWVVARKGGRLEAYHPGGQPQVSTLLYLRPDTGEAVVILAGLQGLGEAVLLDLARAAATLAAR